MYRTGKDNHAEKTFIYRPHVGGFNYNLKNHENSVRLLFTIFTDFYVVCSWWKT